MRLLFILLLTVFFTLPSFAAPKWYLNQEVVHQSFEILGYGEGKTKDEAFMNAASEISSQIIVSVSSKSEFYSSTNGGTSQNKEIKAQTSAILKGLQTVKSEKDDLFYVAVRFINLPLVSQVALRQGTEACAKPENNKYLNQTAFAAEFKEKVGCLPLITWYKTSGVWFAEVEGESYIVPANDFIKLFREGGSDKIVLQPSKSLLKHKEAYHFLINLKEDGYFSLFQMNQSGSVNMLIENEEVKSGMELIYPDIEKYDGLEAMLPDGTDSDKDMAFAALCSDKLDTGLFEEISTKTNFSGKGFMNLLRQTDKCEIYSTVTEVRK